MKYILLIYQNPIAWRSLERSEQRALMDEAGSIVNELIASGEWVGGEGLADPSTAKTARDKGVRPHGSAKRDAPLWRDGRKRQDHCC